MRCSICEARFGRYDKIKISEGSRKILVYHSDHDPSVETRITNALIGG